MAIVYWGFMQGKETKKHIEGYFGQKTLCGVDIPSRGKDWSVYGQAACKRCLKAEKN